MAVSINPYKGTWGRTQVIHLLKRTMFGAKPDDVNYFTKKTLTQVVDELLLPQKNVTEPLNNYNINGYVDTTGIKQGETWVRALYGDGNDNGKRRTSMKSWWVSQMIGQERSLEEKMTLFWSNHFATEMDTINDARFIYRLQNVLRTNSLGNFKVLTKAVTIDPGMLVYLNGYVNTATAPDENYGRELQELFTVGKGPNSKYTEDDVKAAARVLTGYQITRDPVNYTFNINRHDKTDKTFSAFYGNKVIKGQTTAALAQSEVDELLNMIFATNEVAMYVCRRLYQFFFYYTITPEIETNFITPLAKVFRDNNYDIKPVLKTMFNSEHFFDVSIVGALIKSPLDTVVGLCREMDIVFPTITEDLDAAYVLAGNMREQAATMQQDIGDPPNVAGWPAYYQDPQYHELWINADTYPKRKTYTDRMIGTAATAATGYSRNGRKIAVDVIALAKRMQNPEEPNLLIQQLLEILYKVDVTKEIRDTWKKDILLKGQSTDIYWTDAWNAYIAKPTDTMAKNTVEAILRGLIFTIVTQPEFQLS
jgi:uncharacterized protein (DUF1800 family)